MREILFRGKRLDNGEWAEGFYSASPSGNHYITSVVAGVAHLDKIDHTTIGQFTGREDKNGKKVFEHDILQTFSVWADGTIEKAGVGIVQWWEHDQCYVLATKEDYHIDDFGNLGRPEYYEVIGNTTDNPELLHTT